MFLLSLHVLALLQGVSVIRARFVLVVATTGFGAAANMHEKNTWSPYILHAKPSVPYSARPLTRSLGFGGFWVWRLVV